MENALSWRIGTACGVLQNGCLDKSSPMFNVLCANSGAPTLLNFPPNSVFQSDCAGSFIIPYSSFHSAFLALCFIFSQAKSAVVGKFRCCFVLLFLFFPFSFFFPFMFASSLLSASSCFMQCVCIDWPAASVYTYFGLGATCKPLAVSGRYSWFDIWVTWLLNEVTELCFCSLIRWLNLC